MARNYIFSKATEFEKKVIDRLGNNLPNSLKLLMYDVHHFEKFIREKEKIKAEKRKTIRITKTKELVESLEDVSCFFKEKFNQHIVNQELFWVLVSSQKN